VETQDGFIVGIYNYCDRWCERCPLTGRCRVFADVQEHEFTFVQRDAAAAAESLSRLTECARLNVSDTADDPLTRTEASELDALVRTEVAEEDRPLQERTRAVAYRLWDWWDRPGQPDGPALKEALDVIGHYCHFVGAKVYRALMGHLDPEPDEGLQSDANGSAKAALLGLERLQEACLRLVEGGLVSVVDAEPVVSELAWIVSEVERRFPMARRFVRPGLDEPGEVAWLEWQERG
jgi:hypothetical protein